jgi:hypothetical protein
MTMGRTEYRTAANIVAEIKDPLKQAIVYRGFCDLFQTQQNFNSAKFESTCKIIDPIAGLRPKRSIKPRP